MNQELLSVMKMTKNVIRVVFDEDGSCIENIRQMGKEKCNGA